READAVRAGLRTPYLLTAEQQQAFGRRLAEPGSPHRYWSVREAPASETGPAGPTVHGPLVAFTGLTHIEWENGRAEISLLVAPERRGSGIGARSEEHTSELQSRENLVCRPLLAKKKGSNLRKRK